MSVYAWLLQSDQSLNTLISGHLGIIEEAVNESLELLRARATHSVTATKRTLPRRVSVPKTPATPRELKKGSSHKPAVVQKVRPVRITKDTNTPIQRGSSGATTQNVVIQSSPIPPKTDSVGKMPHLPRHSLLPGIDSPLKTPVPTRATGRSFADAAVRDLAGKGFAGTTGKGLAGTTGKSSAKSTTFTESTLPIEPKFESWTSKFVKNTSLGRSSGVSAPKGPPPIVEIAPVTNSYSPVTNSHSPTINAQSPVTNPHSPVTNSHSPVTNSHSPTINAQSPTTNLHSPLSPVIEFVPPPTVTRRTKRPNPAISMEYVESPLTRAKRIDAQNTWREQQLKNFLAVKPNVDRLALPTVIGPSEDSKLAMSNAVLLRQQESSVTKLDIPDLDKTIMDEEPPNAVNEEVVYNFDPISDLSGSSCSSSTKASDEALRKTVMMDSAELEKRQRLRERNEKALQKRKQLLEKAQQIKSNNFADLSGKPRELPKKPSNLPLKVKPASITPVSSLQKQAMVNHAMVRGLVSSGSMVTAPVTAPVTTPVTAPVTGPSGVFKLPLPKLRSPSSSQSPVSPTTVSVSPTKRHSNGHPSSDDTFTIPVSKVVPVRSPASLKLPDIMSEYEQINVGL